jgi:lipopolysaccharide/colanic/teichoic acid biosynthesis glycosyltransferase
MPITREFATEPLRSADRIFRPESQRLIPEGASLGALRQSADSRAFYRGLKRLADVALVLLAAPAALAILAVCAIAILLLMGRPILFVQDRVGRNGQKFRMLKLRTMGISHGPKSTATAVNDPRITPLGGILRRFHFDELPQLWNILVGDMSFVGPRPEQPHLVAHYRSVLPHYDLRHSVTPGLTGWAQVCYGYAADVEETRAKLAYDLYYVRHFGLSLDVIIIARTILIYSNPLYVR